MKYYDKTAELVDRRLIKILNSTESQFKEEKRDFFREHRYILNMLNEKDAECIIDYFGVDDGVFKTYDYLAKKNGCSIGNIRRRLIRGIEALDKPIFRELVSAYTDSDIGYSESTKDQFDFDRLQRMQRTLVDIKNHALEERLSKASEEDCLAEKALNALLNKRFLSCDWPNPISHNLTWRVYNATFNELLTDFTKEDIQNPECKPIVDIVRSFGLGFLEEFEYVKDWRDSCVNGIKKYGSEKLIKSLGLLVSDNIQQVNLLNTCVKNLNFSQRVQTILKHAQIVTLADLIACKESHLSRHRNMGSASLHDIKIKLHDMGLALCPEYMSGAEWINVILGDDKENKETKDNETYIKELCDFDKLMNVNIKLTDIPQRTKYKLYLNSIKTLGDLVGLSKKDVLWLRDIGDISLMEIIESLANYDLTLRPDQLTKVEWLEELRCRFEERAKTLEDNQIMQQSGITNYDDREYARRVYNTLSEDLQYIYKLPVDFIVKHRETLRIIILQNQEIPDEVRYDMVNYVFDCQIDQNLSSDGKK